MPSEGSWDGLHAQLAIALLDCGQAHLRTAVLSDIQCALHPTHRSFRARHVRTSEPGQGTHGAQFLLVRPSEHMNVSCGRLARNAAPPRQVNDIRQPAPASGFAIRGSTRRRPAALPFHALPGDHVCRSGDAGVQRMHSLTASLPEVCMSELLEVSQTRADKSWTHSIWAGRWHRRQANAWEQCSATSSARS